MAQKFVVPITIKQLASAGSDALTVFLDGETYGRVKLEAGGRVSWSDGTGTYDTNLYRDSANVLATDDVLKAVSGIVTLAVAGTPTVELPNGAIAVDTTNHVFYFRSNNTWNQVTGGGGASVTVADTAPESPEVGDLWYDSTTLEIFIYFGTAWVSLVHDSGAEDLEDLGDVLIDSPVAGQVLKYDGAVWINDTDDEGTTINSINDINDVTITTAANGDLLKWNGTAWVNDSALLAAKAPLDSPTFTGTVVLPDNTVALGTKTTGDYVSSLVAGTGITLTNNSGETATPTIAIGQAVATNSNVTFNDLTVSGNLTVSGTTTSINTETLTVDDNIIVLNNNATGSPTENAGIEVERGTSANVFIRWNETNDKWEFTNDGSVYNNLGAGGATISDTAPASPTAGQIWFQSTNGKTFVYYDSFWIEVGGIGTGARMVSSSSAPASPLEGSMWFDTDTAQTFVYYDSSWIEIGASGVTASVQDSAPASPVSGQIWFNSLTGGTYIYYGTNWIEVGASPFSALVNTINAKGDLLVGTADNTIGGLTAGSAGQVLTVDSSTATGLKWATPTTYATTGKSIAMSIVFGGG